MFIAIARAVGGAVVGTLAAYGASELIRRRPWNRSYCYMADFMSLQVQNADQLEILVNKLMRPVLLVADVPREIKLDDEERNILVGLRANLKAVLKGMSEEDKTAFSSSVARIEKVLEDADSEGVRVVMLADEKRAAKAAEKQTAAAS